MIQANHSDSMAEDIDKIIVEIIDKKTTIVLLTVRDKCAVVTPE